MIFEIMVGVLMVGTALIISAGTIASAIRYHAHALYRLNDTFAAREYRERLKEGWTHGDKTTKS